MPMSEAPLPEKESDEKELKRRRWLVYEAVVKLSQISVIFHFCQSVYAWGQ